MEGHLTTCVLLRLAPFIFIAALQGDARQRMASPRTSTLNFTTPSQILALGRLLQAKRPAPSSAGARPACRQVIESATRALRPRA